MRAGLAIEGVANKLSTLEFCFSGLVFLFIIFLIYEFFYMVYGGLYYLLVLSIIFITILDTWRS